MWLLMAHCRWKKMASYRAKGWQDRGEGAVQPSGRKDGFWAVRKHKQREVRKRVRGRQRESNDQTHSHHTLFLNMAAEFKASRNTKRPLQQLVQTKEIFTHKKIKRCMCNDKVWWSPAFLERLLIEHDRPDPSDSSQIPEGRTKWEINDDNQWTVCHSGRLLTAVRFRSLKDRQRAEIPWFTCDFISMR